jgi:hypothetical protein
MDHHSHLTRSNDRFSLGAVKQPQHGVRTKEFMEQKAALQAEMNRLTLLETQERASDVLRSVAEALRATPLAARLQGHGWSQGLMGRLAEECDRIVGLIESGCDPSKLAAMGLGRWIRDTLDPRTTDALHDAVYQADDYLTALAERT